MAEMRTLEIPAELYERLEQEATINGLSLPDYLETLVESPRNIVERLKAEGKNPLLALVGLANDPDDPNLSEEIGDVMRAIYAKKNQSDEKHTD